MNRRQLLALGAVAGGAVLGGGLWGIQPRGTTWPAVGTGRRARLEGERRVVIVGGGLAGMSAAAVLAARGYRVTLCEAGDALGGKLAGWPITVEGVEVPMEHGFHGFFRQYYNLRSLLAEAGADRDLVPQSAYEILFRDRPSEGFRAGWTPFPFSLLEVLARSPTLSLGDVAGDRPGMNALLAYDPVATFAKWDHLDAAAFVREGQLGGPFDDLVLRPFGQASMNALDRFSAAELVRFFHFYMLGNPEGLGFDALGRGVHLSVLAPLRAHLERLGVEIRTGARVRRVVVRGGRAVGVVLDAPGAGPTAAAPVADIPPAGWVAMADGAVFVRRAGAGFEARDARCTHLGCRVALEGAGFRCPCHAGRYDADARPVSGPPKAPLVALPATVVGDTVSIGSGPADELLAADAVVLATEVRGFRALVAQSELDDVDPALVASARHAGEADPYAVVRFWFDRPTLPSRAPFYTVAGYEWTDSLAIYSAFQEPFRSDPGRAVVETHAYGIPPALQGPPSTYRDALLRELREAFPELADAKIRHEEVMAQSNFTRFGPGDFARRPTVATAVPNLFVAGDHVQLPFPAFLMEAAVASGRLAANYVCAADGVTEEHIPTVALRGPLADVLG
jgi:isorenieratene synthase